MQTQASLSDRLLSQSELTTVMETHVLPKLDVRSQMRLALSSRGLYKWLCELPREHWEVSHFQCLSWTKWVVERWLCSLLPARLGHYGSAKLVLTVHSS